MRPSQVVVGAIGGGEHPAAQAVSYTATPAYGPPVGPARDTARRGHDAPRRSAGRRCGSRRWCWPAPHRHGLALRPAGRAIRRSLRSTPAGSGKSQRRGTRQLPVLGPAGTLFWEDVLPGEVGAGPFENLQRYLQPGVWDCGVIRVSASWTVSSTKCCGWRGFGRVGGRSGRGSGGFRHRVRGSVGGRG